MREGETLRKGRRQVYQRREREELFRAHYSGVLAFVLSQVDSLERAKEMTADAFAAVLQRPSSPAPIEPQVALFTHARRAVEADRKLPRTAPPGPRPSAGPPPPRRSLRPPAGAARAGIVSSGLTPGCCREIGLVIGMNEAEVMVSVLSLCAASRRVWTPPEDGPPSHAGRRSRHPGKQDPAAI
jgi:hypothetical protein